MTIFDGQHAHFVTGNSTLKSGYVQLIAFQWDTAYIRSWPDPSFFGESGYGLWDYANIQSRFSYLPGATKSTCIVTSFVLFLAFFFSSQMRLTQQWRELHVSCTWTNRSVASLPNPGSTHHLQYEIHENAVLQAMHATVKATDQCVQALLDVMAAESSSGWSLLCVGVLSNITNFERNLHIANALHATSHYTIKNFAWWEVTQRTSQNHRTVHLHKIRRLLRAIQCMLTIIKWW